MGAIRFTLSMLLCVGLAAPFGACSSDSSSNTDAAALDLATDYAFDLPPGCPPATANDQGIGGACTKGGGECKSPLFCACEPPFGIVPPENTPCACTRFISFQAGQNCASLPANYCGQGAVCCGYMDAVAVCLPTVCLENAMCPVLEP